MNLMERRLALMMQAGSSPYEHGTWEDLFWHIDNKKVSDAYALGEVLPLDLGAQGVVNAQIVAFSADEKADVSGKAAVSFLTQYVLKTTTMYNPNRAGTEGDWTIGTGSIGGWEHSALRAYVRTTLAPLIPANISTRIAPVIKYSRIYNPDGSKTDDAKTIDSVWSPSMRELYPTAATGLPETKGPRYAPFSSDSARIRRDTGGTARPYWLRSAFTTSENASFIAASGKNSVYNTSSQKYYVLLGFCVD